MTRSSLAIAALVLAVAACSAGNSPGPSPTALPIPSPSASATLNAPQLKVVLIERFGPLWYCDPDFYPIAHEDEAALAIQRFEEVKADTDAYEAVLGQLDLAANADFTDAEKLAIYRAWKVLSAIALESSGGDRYRFDYLAKPAGGAAQGMRSAGTIASNGTVVVDSQAPADEPMCPICLARGTRIETPDSAVAVERLRIGDPVWTLDAQGQRIEGVVTAFGSTPAPRAHVMVRLVLADGRTVTASPGHPLADGRRIGSVSAGDAVDASAVVSAKRIAYRGGSTFDIAVSGPTGLYLVNGIALRSTLTP